MVLIQHLGLVGAGASPKEGRAVPRPLPPCDRGDGGCTRAGRLHLSHRGGELRGGVLAARALQALVAPAAGRAPGEGGPGDRRGRGGSAARWSRSSPGGERASSRSTSTAWAPRPPWSALGDAGATAAGDVTKEDSSPGCVRGRAAEAFGGVDIVVSNAGVASSAPIEETRWRNGSATTRFSVPAISWSRGRPSRCCALRAAAAPWWWWASKNALVAGKNAAAYSSAKAAELHLARCLAEEGGPRRDPGEHCEPRCGSSGLPDLGLELARGACGGVRCRARRARGVLPQAHHARRERAAGGHRTGGAALLLRGTLGKEHRGTSST